MEGVRIQMNPEGESVDTNFAKAGSEQQKAAPSPYKTGGRVTRAVVSFDTGEVTMSHSAPAGVKVDAVPAAGATFLNAHGQRADLRDATPDSVIDLGGDLGSTTASVWESMGKMRRLSTGGYEVIGQDFSKPAAPPSAQPVQQQQQQQPPVAAPPASAPVEPVDLSSVKGTSDAAENTLAMLRENAEVHLESMIHEASTGKEISFEAVAQEIGDHDKGESLRAMVVEHEVAGAAVLKAIDPTIDGEVFKTWLQERPNLADSVVRSVLKKDMSVLAEAARAYAEERTADIEARINDAGVKTMRHGKTLMISKEGLGIAVGTADFTSHPWITLAEAIRTEAITINE